MCRFVCILADVCVRVCVAQVEKHACRLSLTSVSPSLHVISGPKGSALCVES